MTTGLLDDLDVPSLAALVSCFTYEHRGRDRPPDPRFPSSTVRTRFMELRRIADDLAADEETAGLSATRAPDAGFVHLAHAWAAGDGLASGARGRGAVGWRLRAEREAAHRPAPRHRRRRTRPGHRGRARQAADALHRGVVTASSAVEVDETGGESGGLCRSRRVSPGASPGRCPRHGVVVRSDAEARADRHRGAPSRRADPAARAPRRRPVPHARRHRRRGPPALGRGGAAARRPRRRARRRPAPLVRGPPRGAARVVARPGRRGHERAVPGRLGRRARGVTRTTAASTCSTPTCPFDERLQVRARLKHGTHVPHPRIDERHQAAVQLELDRPTPVYLDGQRLDDPAKTLSIRVEPDALLCVVYLSVLVARLRRAPRSCSSRRPAAERTVGSGLAEPPLAAAWGSGRRSLRCAPDDAPTPDQQPGEREDAGDRHCRATCRMQAWILDESPGSYRFGTIDDAAGRAGRRGGAARRQRPEPHGPVAHPGPPAADAAPRPGLRRGRRGRGGGRRTSTAGPSATRWW